MSLNELKSALGKGHRKYDLKITGWRRTSPSRRLSKAKPSANRAIKLEGRTNITFLMFAVFTSILSYEFVYKLLSSYIQTGVGSYVLYLVISFAILGLYLFRKVKRQEVMRVHQSVELRGSGPADSNNSLSQDCVGEVNTDEWERTAFWMAHP
jgi:hypothetical protein